MDAKNPTTREELVLALRRIQRDHHNDGDGGYAEVNDVRALLHAHQPETQRSLKALLVDQVSRREPEAWGLAWEVLVQERAVDVGPAVLGALLAGQFDDDDDDYECRDDIVMGLLRIGYQGGAHCYAPYIRDGWLRKRAAILPQVAALARVSPDESIQLAVEYAKEANVTYPGEQLENCIPCFVTHYLDVDEHLLMRLVLEMKKRDVAVGMWFAEILTTYLGKPWTLRELGTERSASLCAQVRAAVGDEN